MASNTVKVNVIGDSSQLTRAFGQGATAGEQFKAQMGLVAKAAVAALAVKALGAVKDFAGASVRAFSDLNESLNAVEVSYGDAAEGIKALGEEAAQNLGLSNAEFNGFAVQMSAFAHDIAGDGGDVVAVVDELSTRVADFASVMNLEVAEAATLFQSGLAGETEPLRRYGIDVSAAAVKAHALATGIADGSGELTEQEKVLSRHSLLMEQTDKMAGDFANTADDLANKERILTAELENQKAELGEGLVPLYNQWLSLQAELIPGLSHLAQAVGRVTGAFDEAQLAVQNIGTDVTDVGAVLDSFREDSINPLAVFSPIALFNEVKNFIAGRSMEEMIGSFEDFLEIADLDQEGLAEMSRQLAVLEQSGELTKEEMDALNEVIDEQTAAIDSHKHAADADRAMLGKYQTAQNDAERATEDTTSAIDEQVAAHRAATDPVAAAIRASRDLREAQDAYTQALRDGDPASQDAQDAALDLIDAQNDLDAALAEIASKGGPNWRAEFRRVASQAGIAEESIQRMIDEISLADGMSATIDIRARVTAPHVRFTPRGDDMVPIKVGDRVFAQHGGIARPRNGGVPVWAAEAGDEEAFIPMNAEGIKILGAALREAMGGMNGGGAPVYITVNALDPQAAGTAVVQALQTYQRSNGAVPIQTR